MFDSCLHCGLLLFLGNKIFDDIDKIQGYRFIKPNLIFETTRIMCDLSIEGTNLCYSDGYVKIKLFQ